MLWITPEALAEALGVDPAEAVDDAWLARTVDAVNQVVTGKRADLAGQQPADHPAVCAGATELAIKMYRARGAANTTGQYDVYSYTARYIDANVAMLLGLDGPVIA